MSRRKMLVTNLLLAALGASLSSAYAATPPTGIYCSCPPTTSRSHSVLESVAAKSFVKGILLRISWADLQPAPGTYNWKLLDDELARAEKYKMKVALAVVNGPESPVWLKDAGIPVFNYTFHSVGRTMPVAWDTAYLDAWTAFIAELGARYSGNPTITLVHMTNATTNGFEMQFALGATDQAALLAQGYTDAKMIDSWKRVMNAYSASFPSVALDVDFHPIFRSDKVAEEVSKHGQQTIGRNFGGFAAWWSKSNATKTYPGMFTLLKQNAAQSFSGLQMVASNSATPSAYNPDGFAATIDYGIRNGARYIEFWESDLLNTSQQRLLEKTANRLK